MALGFNEKAGPQSKSLIQTAIQACYGGIMFYEDYNQGPVDFEFSGKPLTIALYDGG